MGKKQMRINKILVIAAAMMLAMPITAKADAPINTNAPDIYNQMNRQQLLDIERQKKMVKPLVEDDQINENFSMEVEEKDYFKDGVIYNPHFKVNEIIWEGNTKIKNESLDTIAEEVTGREVYFEDLVRLAHKITK